MEKIIRGKEETLISDNYITYHLHSDDSLLDSCTKFKEYVDLAVTNGQKAIASTEHGKPLSWISKKMYCDSQGIKFIHGVEIYLTERLEPKVRDNYHTVLLARNLAGVLELNKLVSRSCDEEHFYYTNRISFDEFLEISDNIISTSACLASPLNKLPHDHPRYKQLVNKYDFLEIQPHNHPEQIAFNKWLVELSQRTGKPLIAGTDTHSSTKYKAECRAVLLGAKHKNYGDEDAFDLTYKTYDELVDMFRVQDAISESDYMQAIENTNLLYDMTENFELDTSIKYPILYGSAEADEEKFIEVTYRKLEEKLRDGTIPAVQEQAFRDAIAEELRVFSKLGMCGFMLSMSELISWCKENGFAIGTARGSVGGSRAAYVTDIIDLNPETWHTVFSRFCNEDRKEIGDIDIDCVETDRPAIFKYIIGRFGADKTARVAAYGTSQAKGVIDDVGRYLAKRWTKEHPGAGKLKGIAGREEVYRDNTEENPWSLPKIAKIKNEFDVDEEKTKKKYPELFYYFDGLVGTKVSQSVHPAGMVISPITLDDNYGVFDKDGESCLMMDMEEAHEVGVAKYDFLVLKTVQVIRDTCKYLGKPYPKTHEIDWEDESVWADMIKCPYGIFQFEGRYAYDSLKRYRPQSIFDMSLVTACIRPSGASYRDDLLAKKPHHNPSKLIDKLLEKNLGYLVYQEDIIAFLQQICGLTGSEADNVRRAIGRKDADRLQKALPQILEGYCEKSDQPRDIAEGEAKEFLQIIDDASSYMFGYNHSIAYCLLGYLCAYYRYYYPIEFITAFLNDAANDEDIRNGTEMAKQYGIIVSMPKWGLSKSNYFFTKEKNIITKGLASVKYMSDAVANELYNLANEKQYRYFVDVLRDIDTETSLNTRQLDILIKLDFFSEFGNQRELLRISEIFFDWFKKGMAKQIKRAAIDGTAFEQAVSAHAVGVTKAGAVSKSYTLLDPIAICRDCELVIKNADLEDLSVVMKAKNFSDAMGYSGYVSGNEEDRRKLFVKSVFPVVSKAGRRFGYNILTQSLGSGKDGRFTVYTKEYDKDPIKKDDVIVCKKFRRDRGYYILNDYEHLYA